MREYDTIESDFMQELSSSMEEVISSTLFFILTGDKQGIIQPVSSVVRKNVDIIVKYP